MQRILVVEDEMQIARTLRDYLEVAGFEVTAVGTGEAALASARGQRPDLVVLDLGLPGMDGLDVARELRRTSTIPIVMLTARGEESDRIVGLELGGDDYLVKPFSPKELVARVRAVLRRTSGAGAAPRSCAPARWRSTSRRCACGSGTAGRPHPHGVPAPRDAGARAGARVHTGPAAGRAHGVTIDSYERAIDAHVKNLRRKIEPEVGRPRYVLTVHGVGYRFADD